VTAGKLQLPLSPQLP